MEYLSIFEENEASIEIKRSEFIAHVFHVESAEEALFHVEEVKKRHYKARHNCYAFVTGKSGEIIKASDDGEPQSTAGRPILQAIENNSLKDVLIVVTRYFGGIKLGANGLVRAYMAAANEVIGISEKELVRDCIVMDIGYDYSLHGRVDTFLRGNGISSEEPEFTELVSRRIYVPAEKKDSVSSELVQISNARMEITETGTKTIRFKGEEL